MSFCGTPVFYGAGVLTFVYHARTSAYGATHVSHFVANGTRQRTYSKTHFASHLAGFAVLAHDTALPAANFAGFGPAVRFDYAFTETF
jgi:hypothetical protein